MHAQRHDTHFRSMLVVVLLLTLLGVGSAGGQQETATKGSAQAEECRPGEAYKARCYEKIVQTIPMLKDRIDYLARVADQLQDENNSLQERVSMTESEISTLKAQTQLLTLQEQSQGESYQIAASRWTDGTGLSFTQVFRINTKTGAVCQVLAPNSRNGEAAGTSIPVCPFN